MKTKREIVLADWRGYGPLTIPAGTRVSEKLASGPQDSVRQRFVENFAKLFPPNSVQLHDATYYGIRVNENDCE